MDSEPSNCHDCGIDTTPGDATPEKSDGRWEFYMVRDEIWIGAGMQDDGFLCIGCLEARLGRRLAWHDFTHALINLPGDLDTPRCYDRKHTDDPVLQAIREAAIRMFLAAHGYTDDIVDALKSSQRCHS